MIKISGYIVDNQTNEKYGVIANVIPALVKVYKENPYIIWNVISLEEDDYIDDNIDYHKYVYFYDYSLDSAIKEIKDIYGKNIDYETGSDIKQEDIKNIRRI